MEISTHEPSGPTTEVSVLQRKLVDSRIVISKYKVGKSIVTVERLFLSEKTFQYLLFQIVRNKLKK